MTDLEKKEICDKCDISYACDYKSMPDCEDFKEKEIKSIEDCKWFGAKTPQKPCGQCDKKCQYNDNKTQKDYQKEIEEMTNISKIICNCIAECQQIKGYCGANDMAGYLYKAGYGKVEDLKKEIKKLKEKIEALLNANSATPFITSSIGDLPINTDGLLKAIDEITRLNRVQTELQELNMKYYNEAKDCERRIKELQNEIIKLKEDREKCINALSDEYSFKTTQDNILRVFDIVRKQAVEEFAEKLKKRYSIHNKDSNFIALFELNDLLKEYGE